MAARRSTPFPLHSPGDFAARLAGLLLALIVAFAGTSAQGQERLPTRLFYGGTFHTGGANAQGRDGDREPLAARTVEAVLVRDSRIVALGNYGEVSGSREAEGAERVDMGGAQVFPGFQDGHIYLERYGATLEDVDLTGAKSFGEAVARVAEAASALPAGEWILGSGWDESLWEGQALPGHERLTAAVPDHPVLVTRVDGQVGLVNALALAKAGLDVDADGETGLVTAERLERVAAAAPEPSRAARRRRLLRAQDRLLALGVTAVHAMDVERSSLEIMAELRDRGELRLRVVGYLDSLRTAETLGSERLAGLGDRYDWLTVAGICWEVDGGFGSRGAALLAPYADAPEERGRLSWKRQDLSAAIEKGARLGLQPSIRATGDRAVRAALGAIRDARERASGFELLRPRVEYMQLVAEQDLDLMGRLRVIPVMMPGHLATDLRWVTERLGKARASSAYGWRTLTERASLPPAFGTASPIGQPSPMLGIHAAVTRQDWNGEPSKGFYAAERLSARASLAGWTSGAATAAGQEEVRGRIALGYAADFTALSVDLMALDVANAREQLGGAKVLATVVNGEIVYRAAR